MTTNPNCILCDGDRDKTWFFPPKIACKTTVRKNFNENISLCVFIYLKPQVVIRFVDKTCNKISYVLSDKRHTA